MSLKKANETLNDITEIFDTCGVINITQAKDKSYSNIPKGSTFKLDGKLLWPNALAFIEWYALPMMPNFKFILVDNMDLAENLPK